MNDLPIISRPFLLQNYDIHHIYLLMEALQRSFFYRDTRGGFRAPSSPRHSAYQEYLSAAVP